MARCLMSLRWVIGLVFPEGDPSASLRMTGGAFLFDSGRTPFLSS